MSYYLYSTIKGLCIGTITLLLVACGVSATPTPEPAEIVVKELINRVDTERPATQTGFSPAQVGQNLLPGDGVKTFQDSEARVDIVIRDFLRIFRSIPNTIWRLGQFAVDQDTIIELDQGRIYVFDEESGDDPRSFKVVTPAGVASVRGTWMSVSHDPVTGVTGVQCFRGECELSNEYGTQILTDQQVSRTTKDTPPGRPESLTEEEIRGFTTLPEVQRGEVAIPTPTHLVDTPTPPPADAGPDGTGNSEGESGTGGGGSTSAPTPAAYPSPPDPQNGGPADGLPFAEVKLNPGDWSKLKVTNQGSAGQSFTQTVMQRFVETSFGGTSYEGTEMEVEVAPGQAGLISLILKEKGAENGKIWTAFGTSDSIQCSGQEGYGPILEMDQMSQFEINIIDAPPGTTFLGTDTYQALESGQRVKVWKHSFTDASAGQTAYQVEQWVSNEVPFYLVKTAITSVSGGSEFLKWELLAFGEDGDLSPTFTPAALEANCR